MKKILFVNACVRPQSRTNVLAKYLLDKLDGQTEELDLGKEDIEPLNLERLEKRDLYISNKDFSDDMFRYAKQFVGADIVVIAAPYWDLSFPAVVKSYIEAVSVQGLTFHYTEEGIHEGWRTGTQVIYVTTAGGPIGAYNLGIDYVKTACGGLLGTGGNT